MGDQCCLWWDFPPSRYNWHSGCHHRRALPEKGNSSLSLPLLLFFKVSKKKKINFKADVTNLGLGRPSVTEGSSRGAIEMCLLFKMQIEVLVLPAAAAA